jgi:hypothetical protein
MGAFTPTNQNNPTSAQQGKGIGSPQQGSLASPPAQVQKPGGKGLGQEMPTPPTQIQVPSSVNSTSMADVMPTTGQPQMGQPNKYSNTIRPWDNSSMKPQMQSGKGKGQ